MEISEAVVVIVETFNRDDIEGFIASCTPDVELKSLRGMLEDVVYRGHDGLREFQRDSEAAWSERHAQLVDVETRGDEAVLIARMRMKGQASGVLTERTVAFAVRLRDGSIARMTTHPDAGSARRELGWTT
jgi:ketosteroid isomerase-like protein